jgi:hypothetical protein
MFTRTAQPGLWFIAGSFAQCRIYSKYLALQIKACEAGLLPKTLAGRGFGRDPTPTASQLALRRAEGPLPPGAP